MMLQNKVFAALVVTWCFSSSWAFVPSSRTMTTRTTRTFTSLNLYPSDKKKSDDEKNSITSTSSSLESSQTSDENEINYESSESGEEEERTFLGGLKQSLPSRREAIAMGVLSLIYTGVRNGDKIVDSMKQKVEFPINENGEVTSFPFFAPEPVMVLSWPGTEYLEPFMELVALIEFVDKICNSNKPALIPYAQRRLEYLFKGGYFHSGRSFYAAFSLRFQGEIQYDFENELQTKIIADQNNRFLAMERTLNSLEHLLKELQKKEVDIDVAQVLSLSATNCMKVWMANIPPDEIVKAKQLYQHYIELDTGGKGYLSEREISRLSEEEQIIWKKREYLIK